MAGKIEHHQRRRRRRKQYNTKRNDVDSILCLFQVIGTRNKGTVTRSADFGRTPVSDIFRGELRSRLQREGDHTTDVIHSFQPFFTLQLNIEVSAAEPKTDRPEIRKENNTLILNRHFYICRKPTQ